MAVPRPVNKARGLFKQACHPFYSDASGHAD